MSSAEEDILEATRRFMADASTREEDVAQLRRFLDFRPKEVVVENTLAFDEMAYRLSFAKKALDAMKLGSRYELRCFDLSVIFSLPLEALREMETQFSLPIHPFDDFDLFSKQAERVARVFLQCSGIAPEAKPPKTKLADQDTNEVSKCLARDRAQCVLLQTSNPEVCHIVPFAATASEETCEVLRVNRNVLKSLAGDDYTLLAGDPGCSDKAWNMISLNGQLCKWWRSGYFACKCLGISPTEDEQATVMLQFHWMLIQKTLAEQGTAEGAAWSQKLPTADQEAWAREWEERVRHGHPGEHGDGRSGDGGVVAAANAVTGRLIQTGHVVNITMPTMEDGRRMKAMMDVQWAMIKMASMSGAAGSPEFLYDSDAEFESDEDV